MKQGWIQRISSTVSRGRNYI